MSFKAMFSVMLLLAMAGCAPKPQSSPPSMRAVLNAYYMALQAGRYDRAYDQMSSSFRQKFTREQYIRLLQEDPAWLKQNIQRLSSGPSKIQMTARAQYANGEFLAMVEEGGAWKISVDPTDFYSQRSPREALHSFIKAVDRRRFDVLLRFVPTQWAAKMTTKMMRDAWDGTKKEEVATLLQNLKANQDAAIRLLGQDRASMPYGDKHEVRFIREDGLWKIEDPD